jgi:outer membrane biosynthesis protein TonB
MRALLATLAFAAGLAAALGLASCGGGSEAKLLPGQTARQINENLAAVRTLVAEGECVDAEDAAQQVGTQVEDLQGIDARLKQALQEGAERLNEVVLECTEETTEEDTEEALPTTTEETEPEKPEKEKPGKEKHEEEEEVEPPEEEVEEVPKPEQEPPKGKGQGPEPPAPPEHPSGGIGPGSAAEGD